MSRDTRLVVAMLFFTGLLFVCLAALGAVLLLLAQQPQEVAAGPQEDLPPLPSQPEGVTVTPVVISTIPPFTDTPAPTDTLPPTATPEASSTPEVTAEPSAEPTNTSPPQPTAPPPPPPTATPAPPTSIKGLTASMQVEGGRTTFAPNEQIWINFQVNNPTQSNVKFGRLGFSIEEVGVGNMSDLFHTSYSETTLTPGDQLLVNYRDWTSIPRAGTFNIRLSICYPDIATCDGGSGQWEALTLPATVTIQ